MRLWRIAAETRTYDADDTSGEGAAKQPGRWNDVGERMLYTAPTIAMAVLETAAHVDDGGLPLNRFLVRLDVPGDVWNDRHELGFDQLPATWSAVPAGKASVALGSAWLKSLASAVLLVPSAIVPEEPISLINPLHPDASRISVASVRPFEYGRLFR